MASNKIVFEISIDELTMWVKDKSGLSDKKVEQVVEKLKDIDFHVFLDQEIEHYCDEIDDESSEEEDAHKCELCNKYVEETEYLPSKEDQEKQQILGNDYCLECYKKVENFEFVENIDLDKHE